MHLISFSLNLTFFSYLTLNNEVKVTKTASTLSCLGFKSCKFGYNPLNHSKENVHIKVFDLEKFLFQCDLENKVKVPKSLAAFCHVHVLDSCELR